MLDRAHLACTFILTTKSIIFIIFIDNDTKNQGQRVIHLFWLKALVTY